MKQLSQRFSSDSSRDAGQGMAEFIIIVILVAIAVLVSVRMFGRSVDCQFTEATGQIDTLNRPVGSTPGCSAAAPAAAPPAPVPGPAFVPAAVPPPPAEPPPPAPPPPPASPPAPAPPPPPAPPVDPAPPPPPAPPPATQEPPPPATSEPVPTPVVASTPSSPSPSPSPSPTPSPTYDGVCYFNCAVTRCNWVGSCSWDWCTGGGPSLGPVMPVRYSNLAEAVTDYNARCSSATTQAECEALTLPVASWQVLDPAKAPSSGSSRIDMAASFEYRGCVHVFLGQQAPFR